MNVKGLANIVYVRSSRSSNLISIDRSDDNFQWFQMISDNIPLETLTISVVESNICVLSIKMSTQSSFNLRCRCYVIFHINLVDSIRMRVGFTFLYCMIFRKSTVLYEKKQRDLNWPRIKQCTNFWCVTS